MRILLAGLSHKSAPVEVREKLVLAGPGAAGRMHGLRDATGMEECAVLSTCNRTEVYGLTREEDWQEQVLEFLADVAGFKAGHLQEYLYFHEGTPAVRHLFRVAAGLDSMVVGEGQVLGQVKQAHADCLRADTGGTVVSTLFQYAVGAGKRVRTETGIGRGAVSVSLAAVQLARQIFQSLNGKVILLLGAGETAEQTAKMLLAERTHPRLLVHNRTPERARELADTFGGEAVPADSLDAALVRADIVIASTAAPEPVLGTARIRAASRARRGRPLFLVDIAVPRDVEPTAGELEDVYLYNIDDLQQVVSRNLDVRHDEIASVEAIIEEEVTRFQSWLRCLDVAPTIRELQGLAEAIVAAEQERVGARLSHLSARDRDVVDTLVRGVVNKLIRPPILHLRQAAEGGNGYHEVENVRAIFGLGAGDEE